MILFKGFGLIDIIFVSLCILITYEALLRGFFLEIFQTAALFLSAMLSFQLYPFLTANVVEKSLFLIKDYSKFLAFCFLFFSIIFVLGILSRILAVFFKREEISPLEKGFSIFVGLLRAIFLSSVIVFMVYLFPVKNNFFTQGISKEFLKNIAPKIYLNFTKACKKNQPNFKANEEVEKLYEVKSDISGNSKKGN